MTKDIQDQREARPLRGAPTRRNVGSGEDKRREQATNRSPSVAEIAKLYKRDDHSPFTNVKAGDGLVDRKQHEYDTMIQKPQFREDQHDNSKHGRYDNHTQDGWLRGSGLSGATTRPHFDHGGRRTLRDPPKRGDGELVGSRNISKSVADNSPKSVKGLGGIDARQSPFSSAHRPDTFNLKQRS